MADVAIDPQNINSNELYGQGVRAFVLQDFDTAVRAFSRASELLSAEHGNDTHDSLGDVYLYYGKSLLELSRRDSGPLGDGVLKNIEEESESEEVVESEGEEEKTEKESETEEGSKVNGDSDQKDTEKTEESKPDEETAKSEDKLVEEPNKEEANKSVEKKENDEAEDLQVAWEVLELAKKIFVTRGAEGKKNLAETLIILGEISLECGNFSSAVEDMKEGLEIQKTIFGNDSRTIAETFYKLGGALSTNGQIDEAIQSFSSSNEYLNNKLNNLKKDEENKEANAEEIEELNSLIPEVQEKIADMKNLKVEVANKVSSSVEEAKPSSNGNSEASSSSKQANDISHLVKRKRKDDEDTSDETPAKKPSP